MRKTLIIIQARMGSSRLPGKVLMEIDSKPLLWYMISRLRKLKNPADLLLATTDSSKDTPLVKFSEEIKIKIYRGSENDVLDRFYQGAKLFCPDIVVRVTGDCPLIDPSVIDEGLAIFNKNSYDYLSNVHPPTYPDGYDVEIFTFQALEKAWKEAKKTSEREHVTPFIWNHPELFNLGNYQNDIDYSNYRLTVDEAQDFELIKNIILYFKSNWQELKMKEIISFLDQRKDLKKLNAQFERNEGYIKSLKQD
jgi:spore coat polysaccharide biosynthesis protein SpsF